MGVDRIVIGRPCPSRLSRDSTSSDEDGLGLLRALLLKFYEAPRDNAHALLTREGGEVGLRGFQNP